MFALAAGQLQQQQQPAVNDDDVCFKPTPNTSELCKWGIKFKIHLLNRNTNTDESATFFSLFVSFFTTRIFAVKLDISDIIVVDGEELKSFFKYVPKHNENSSDI